MGRPSTGPDVWCLECDATARARSSQVDKGESRLLNEVRAYTVQYTHIY